jgi:hypothetical protein
LFELIVFEQELIELIAFDQEETVFLSFGQICQQEETVTAHEGATCTCIIELTAFDILIHILPTCHCSPQVPATTAPSPSKREEEQTAGCTPLRQLVPHPKGVWVFSARPVRQQGKKRNTQQVDPLRRLPHPKGVDFSVQPLDSKGNT